MGISAAVGIALGARLQRLDSRTYVLLGDGECQEGSVWESAFVAARYRLDRLVAIIDHNRLQQYGWQGDSYDHRLPPEEPGELVASWSAFGWRVFEVTATTSRTSARARRGVREDGRPMVIIAYTVKGRGVSFAEGRYEWHTRIPKAVEFAQAMAELGEPAEADEAAADDAPHGPRDARGLRRDGYRARRRDPRVVMLDGDLGVSTKADIFQKAHPERFLQIGIAEQNMLGIAAGLASVGMMPFISTFVPFAVVRPARPNPRAHRAAPPQRQDHGRLRGAVRGRRRQDPPGRRRRLDHARHARHGHDLAGRRHRDRLVLLWAAA